MKITKSLKIEEHPKPIRPLTLSEAIAYLKYKPKVKHITQKLKEALKKVAEAYDELGITEDIIDTEPLYEYYDKEEEKWFKCWLAIKDGKLVVVDERGYTYDIKDAIETDKELVWRLIQTDKLLKFAITIRQRVKQPENQEKVMRLISTFMRL